MLCARTQGWDLFGEIALLTFGDDLPPEITWGRRALAMTYKWLGRVRRGVIDMLFTSYLNIEKALSSGHLHAVEVRPAMSMFSGARIRMVELSHISVGGYLTLLDTFIRSIYASCSSGRVL